MLTTGRNSHRIRTEDWAMPVRSACARLLLIAVGVQGITPDLDNVVSSRVLQCLVAESPNSSPSYGEVSEPTRPEQDAVKQLRDRSIYDEGFALIGLMPDCVMFRHRHVAATSGGLMGTDGLIHLLCHLTC